MNRYLVALGNKKVDGLVPVRKRISLTGQKVPQLVATANPRLTKGAAVANKIRRNQLIEAPPVLSVTCLDERSDDYLLCFSHLHTNPSSGSMTSLMCWKPHLTKTRVEAFGSGSVCARTT